MKTKLLLLGCIFIFTKNTAQTQFWSDNFETRTSHTSGNKDVYDFGTSLNINNDNPLTGVLSNQNFSGNYFTQSGPPATRYFDVTNGQNGVDISVANAYTNKEGSKFLAGEDLDNSSTLGEHRSIHWTNINISGKSGLQFRGLFATANSAVWDHYPTFSPVDYITVFYSIDGGSWINGIAFRASIANSGVGSLSKIDNYPANFDVNIHNNTIGNGVNILTSTFTEYAFNISGTGSTISLRFDVHSNSLNEEFAIDNFRLYETILSTESFDNNTKLVVSPNPSNGIYAIEIDTNSTIEVYDIIGKQLKSHKIAIGNTQLDLSKYNSGIYFLKVTNELNQTKTVKLIKE